MKKIFALVLALMLVAIAVPAMAATTTISVPQDDTHEYSVYQIFTGDLSGNVLSNLVWGKNGTGYVDGDTTAVDKTVLDALTAVTSATTDAAKLAVIEQYWNSSSDAYGTVKSTAALDNVPTGYYLIKDAAAITGDDVATTYIVQIVGPTTINRKAAKPSFDKTVEDETADAEEGHTSGFGESADHEINESFKFKLTATLEADTDYAKYDKYYVAFVDNFSNGVTYEGIDSVTITSDGKSYTIAAGSEDNQYVLTDGNTGTTAEAINTAKGFKLSIADLKKVSNGTDTLDITKGAVITVVYSAHLNEDALIATESDDDANKDSGNVNYNKGKLQYSNNPNASGSGSDTPGETPEDFVWVFTYESDNIKIDGDVNNGTDVTDTLDQDIKGQIDAAPNKTLTIGGKTYRKEGDKYYELAGLAGASFKLKKGDTVIKLIDNKDGSYTVADQDATVGQNNVVDTMTTTADHKTLNIKGLDHDTYTLVETGTPAGYNTASDTTVTFTAVHKENQTGTTVALTLTEVGDDNAIINEKGSTLPETGGIGTTIFYIAGSILVLAAVVLLVTKRRMNAEK